MSTEFSRSMRLLTNDNYHRAMWWLLAVTILLGMWAGWFFLARVSVYEVATTAHVEMIGAIAIQAPEDGEIVAVHTATHDLVRAGDVLFDLDTASRRLRIRAPIAGQIAVVHLRVGTFVAAGDDLGTVVPPGDLRIVAEFSPQTTLVHIRLGQSARVRLADIPSSQYGNIRAVVTRILGMSREGQ